MGQKMEAVVEVVGIDIGEDQGVSQAVDGGGKVLLEPETERFTGLNVVMTGKRKIENPGSKAGGKTMVGRK